MMMMQSVEEDSEEFKFYIKTNISQLDIAKKKKRQDKELKKKREDVRNKEKKESEKEEKKEKEEEEGDKEGEEKTLLSIITRYK